MRGHERNQMQKGGTIRENKLKMEEPIEEPSDNIEEINSIETDLSGTFRGAKFKREESRRNLEQNQIQK